MPKESITFDSNTSLVFSTFLHVLILFAILSALFVLVIAKLEEQIFTDEIGKHVKEQLPESIRKADKNGVFKTFLKGIELDRFKQFYNKPSPESKIYNDWLKITMVLTAVSIFAIMVVAGLFLFFTCGKLIPLGNILLENAVIFLLVGLFEGAFFYFVASKYIPVKPSMLMNRLYSDLKNW